MTLTNKLIQISTALLLCSSLTACGTADRIADIGKAPEVTAIANPVTKE